MGKILCLDFDGVCHMFTSPWVRADVIPDDAVPGLFEFLERAEPHFSIQVYSARSHATGGIKAMKSWFKKQHDKWLEDHGYDRKEHPAPSISYPKTKPGATVVLDDRAIEFRGRFPEIDTLLKFKPWNAKKKTRKE